jgi:hypothetical protein
MIKMTEEMRDLIDNAIANGTPCILATATKTGEPHMSFRGSMMVFGDFRKRLYCDRVRLLRGVSREVNPYRFREIVSWPGPTLRLHFLSR